MTLDIWNTPISVKFVYIYCNEVKIIAITYYLATLAILATKIAITWLPGNRIDLGLVALDSH